MLHLPDFFVLDTMNSNAAFTRGCQQVGFGNISPLLSLDESDNISDSRCLDLIVIPESSLVRFCNVPDLRCLDLTNMHNSSLVIIL